MASTEQVDDALDDLLVGANPYSDDLPKDVEAELGAMARGARSRVRRPRARAGRRRTVGAIVAFSVVLGSAGAAAAATVDSWKWWKEEKPQPTSFTLPSGGTCELKYLTNIQGPGPEVSALAGDFLRSTDLADVVDVEAELAKLMTVNGGNHRAGAVWSSPLGHVEFEQDHVTSPDQRYYEAFHNGILPAVSRYLETRGHDVDPYDLFLSVSTDCDWGPE